MKVNHYARPVNATLRSASEGTILQLVFGILSAGFAIGGYNAKVPQLMIPCGFVSLLCFGMLFYSIYEYFEDKNYQKKLAAEKALESDTSSTNSSKQ